MIITEALTQGRTQEHRLRRFVRIHRQIGAALHLQKTGFRQHLPERREHSESRGARSESPGAVPRWQCRLALNAQDRSGMHIREEHALPAKHHVAHPAQPSRGGMTETEWDRDLELIPLAVPLFENELIVNTRCTLQVDAGLDERFV